MLGDGAIELFTYSSGRYVETLLKHINNQLNTNVHDFPEIKLAYKKCLKL